MALLVLLLFILLSETIIPESAITNLVRRYDHIMNCLYQIRDFWEVTLNHDISMG